MTYNDAIKFLGLEPEAREPDIKKAYRQLAGRLHPDAGGPAHLFVLLREAYEVALKGDYQPEPEVKPEPTYNYTYQHRPSSNFDFWGFIKPFLFLAMWGGIVIYCYNDLMPIYYDITNMINSFFQIGNTMSL
jgi:hypothetical protein